MGGVFWQNRFFWDRFMLMLPFLEKAGIFPASV
jgi:hypothetical protein